MGAYRAALTSIWPGHPVATAILWTRTGLLMRLPADLVAAALLRAADLDPVGRRS
jgi:ATP-dependent helicase/nuclease subunit A